MQGIHDHIPPSITNYGVQPRSEWLLLLSKSQFFMGLKVPQDGPSVNNHFFIIIFIFIFIFILFLFFFLLFYFLFYIIFIFIFIFIFLFIYFYFYFS